MQKRPSKQIHNRPELKGRRKALRQYGTSAEVALWLLLKGKQLDGRKFRRQHSIGKYVVDFYCPSEKLVVELDGEPHYTKEGLEYDEKRSSFLDEQGIRVLRFENSTVFDHPDQVLSRIRSCFNPPQGGLNNWSH